MNPCPYMQLQKSKDILAHCCPSSYDDLLKISKCSMHFNLGPVIFWTENVSSIGLKLLFPVILLVLLKFYLVYFSGDLEIICVYIAEGRMAFGEINISDLDTVWRRHWQCPRVPRNEQVEVGLGLVWCDAYWRHWRAGGDIPQPHSPKVPP